MIRLDSTNSPVVLAEERKPWGQWILTGALALLAASVPLSLVWHPVHWWGWAGMLAALAGAIMVGRSSSPAQSSRLVGDGIEITSDGQTRTVPASQIAGVLTMSDSLSPVLQLVDGDRLPLRLPGLWKGTAYPTVRLLSNWVLDNGGGALPASETEEQSHESLGDRERSRRSRLRPDWPATIARFLLIWLALCLVRSTLAGHPRPHFGGWAQLIGSLLATLWYPANRGPTDWTKTRNPW